MRLPPKTPLHLRNRLRRVGPDGALSPPAILQKPLSPKRPAQGRAPQLDGGLV